MNAELNEVIEVPGDPKGRGFPEQEFRIDIVIAQLNQFVHPDVLKPEFPHGFDQFGRDVVVSELDDVVEIEIVVS